MFNIDAGEGRVERRGERRGDVMEMEQKLKMNKCGDYDDNVIPPYHALIISQKAQTFQM